MRYVRVIIAGLLTLLLASPMSVSAILQRDPNLDHAEQYAQKIIDTEWLRQGDSFFTKVQNTGNVIELKDLRIIVSPTSTPFTRVELLNGYEWRGTIRFQWSAERYWFPREGWEEWQEGGGTISEATKKRGVWKFETGLLSYSFPDLGEELQFLPLDDREVAKILKDPILENRPSLRTKTKPTPAPPPSANTNNARPQMTLPPGDPKGVLGAPSDSSGHGGDIGSGRSGSIGTGRGKGISGGDAGGSGGGTGNLRPTILSQVKPKYTEEARQNKIHGKVVLSVEFLSDGTIGDIRVVRGLGYGLDEKAIEAARLIRFRPAVQNGRPVPSRVKVEFAFYNI